MAVVQVQPLEEIILSAELNILIDIFAVVATLGDMPTINAIALFFSPK